MLKFIRSATKVEIDPLSIQIQGLKTIYLQDISESKETANKMLTYIHLVSQVDVDAPYYSASPYEVEMLVKKDMFGDMEYSFGDKEDFIAETIEEYRKAYEIPEERSIRVFNNKLDEMTQLLDDTTVTIVQNEVKGVTTWSSNSAILNKIMLDMNKISQEKKKLQAVLQKEKSKATIIRAGKRKSFLEKKLSEAKSKKLLPDGSALDEESTEIEASF